MSVGILSATVAVWIATPDGEPLFLVSEEWGSNNCSDGRTGQIARNWSARYFGTFSDVMSAAANYPSCWHGGSSQVTAGGNAYRESSATAYLARVEAAMRAAGRVSDLAVDIDRSSYKAPTHDEIASFYGTLKASPHGPPETGSWSVSSGAPEVRVLLELWRFAATRVTWAETMFSAVRWAAYPGEKPAVPAFRSVAYSLPDVFRVTGDDEADRRFAITAAGPRFASSYGLYDAVVDAAQGVARLGGDPRKVYRAFAKKLRQAPLADPVVTFTVCKHSAMYEPVRDAGYGVGDVLTRPLSALLPVAFFMRPLEKGAFSYEMGGCETTAIPREIAGAGTGELLGAEP